jgi:Flp pilus assembly protein TadD/SAM-dependent methyltransferase
MSNKVRLKKKPAAGGNRPAKGRNPDGAASRQGQTIQTALQLHQGGYFQQAAEYYRQVLTADPRNPRANHLLGTLYYQTGNLAAALPLVEKAILAKPDYAEAHNLLGSIHHASGRYEQAIFCYRKALIYQPDFAMAHNNLGIVLEATGQYQAALNCYQSALAIQPGYAEAHANRGIVYRNLGRIDDAITSYGLALILKPDFREAYYNFSALLQFHKILPDSLGSASDRKNLLTNCLNRDDLESQNFFYASFHELFRGDNFGEAQRFICSEDNSESYLHFIENSPLRRLLSEPLFLLVLRKTIVADPLAERFLTRLRKGLTTLLAMPGMDEQFYVRITPLVCALAQQCFWNEYVFQTTAEEAGFLSVIAGQPQVASSFAAQKSLVGLAIQACYAPLNTQPRAEKIHDLAGITDRDFAELLRIQLVEPRQEKELFERLQSFSEIKDPVSQLVKQQYEENPYPRWTGISMVPPQPFIECLRQEIAPNSLTVLRPIERPEVLIAGCGTGRQPIRCAVAYLNSSLTAIDLSLASLAYAKRKAHELGISNIEFIQGDLLALGNLDKTFDIIECSGVLHHMSEPENGLRVLVDLLRPSGYMKIGLYSELARQHVVAAREFVKNQGFSPTIAGIRAGRQALLALPDDDPAKLVSIGQDFYAASTVRDLIFHVQEHRFTLPEIARLLEKFNLEFLGFDLGIEVKNAYLAEHPDDPGAISLTLWHQYELQNSETFFKMYNFWVRKKLH